MKRRPHKAPQGKVVGRSVVLRRLAPERLAELEARAGRGIPKSELRELHAAADAAYERVPSVGQLLSALRQARLRQGLSQTDVDKRSGIGRANVSRLENLHLDNPRFDTLLRYAQAVGMKLTLQSADNEAT